MLGMEKTCDLTQEDLVVIQKYFAKVTPGNIKIVQKFFKNARPKDIAIIKDSSLGDLRIIDNIKAKFPLEYKHIIQMSELTFDEVDQIKNTVGPVLATSKPQIIKHLPIETVGEVLSNIREKDKNKEFHSDAQKLLAEIEKIVSEKNKNIHPSPTCARACAVAPPLSQSTQPKSKQNIADIIRWIAGSTAVVVSAGLFIAESFTWGGAVLTGGGLAFLSDAAGLVKKKESPIPPSPIQQNFYLNGATPQAPNPQVQSPQP